MAKMDQIFALLGLFVFIAFFYSYWKTLCLDWARQLMFEERAKLFSIACDKRIEFSSPVYRTLRTHIEGMIRFVHVLSWPKLVLWSVIDRVLPGTPVTKSSSVQAMIATEPDALLRQELRRIYIRVGFAALVCVMGRSIVLGPLFLILYVSNIVRENVDAEWLKNIYDRVVRIMGRWNENEATSKVV